MNDVPPYTFGQTVWLSIVSQWDRIKVPCPVCYGKLRVTVLLGNGEAVEVECDYCGKGYAGPTGTAFENKATGRVVQATVTGMANERGEWRVTTTPDGYADSQRFETQAEAEADMAVRLKAAEARVADQVCQQQCRARRAVTWHAGYHTAAAARDRRSAEYHEAKAKKLRESAAYLRAQAKAADLTREGG